MKKTSKQKRVPGRARMDMLSIPHPPSYVNNSIVSRRYRFQNTYTASAGLLVYTITPSKLCALQVIGTVVNTTAAQLFEAVRVRSVEVWASPGVDGNIYDISVVFPGTALGIQGPDRSLSAQTIGVSVPAYVKLKPGKETQAAQWLAGRTDVGIQTLFLINISGSSATGGTNITIDVNLALRMTADARTTNNTVPLTTVALSAMYYLALDNPAGGTGSSTNLLIPDRTLVTTT